MNIPARFVPGLAFAAVGIAAAVGAAMFARSRTGQSNPPIEHDLTRWEGEGGNPVEGALPTTPKAMPATA
jgi:hypothetical protein